MFSFVNSLCCSLINTSIKVIIKLLSFIISKLDCVLQISSDCIYLNAVELVMEPCDLHTPLGKHDWLNMWQIYKVEAFYSHWSWL